MTSDTIRQTRLDSSKPRTPTAQTVGKPGFVEDRECFVCGTKGTLLETVDVEIKVKAD